MFFLEEIRRNIKEIIVVILSPYQPLNSTVLSLHFTTYIFTTLLRSYSLDVQSPPSPVLHITCPFLLICSLHCKMSSTDDPQMNPSVVHRKSCYLELDHAKFVVIFDREPWYGKYEVDASSLSSQKTSICLS